MAGTILNSVNSSCLNFASESYPPVARGDVGTVPGTGNDVRPIRFTFLEVPKFSGLENRHAHGKKG